MDRMTVGERSLAVFRRGLAGSQSQFMTSRMKTFAGLFKEDSPRAQGVLLCGMESTSWIGPIPREFNNLGGKTPSQRYPKVRLSPAS
jgi:hypothetical protein